MQNTHKTPKRSNVDIFFYISRPTFTFFQFLFVLNTFINHQSQKLVKGGLLCSSHFLHISFRLGHMQYIIVGPLQKETVRSSKLGILSPFEIHDGDFRKNPVAAENFITQSNLNRLNILISIKRFCNKKIASPAKLFMSIFEK